MSAERFFMSETNPNDGIGGGGCLCSPLKCEDGKGPYAVFSAIETDSNLSPHVVICAGCAISVAGKCTSGAELMQSGEKDTVLPPTSAADTEVL